MTTQTTTIPRRGMLAWTTRDLMVLVAFALVFGLLLTGMSYVVALTAGLLTPMLGNALFGGIWLLPSLMASYILRRPGTALLMALLYSLVQVPLSPYGIAVMFGGVIGGVCYELPFLITRYRRYGLAMLVGGGGLANLATVAISGLMQGGLNLAPGLLLGVAVAGFASGALAGWLSKLLADSLVRAGLLGGTALGRERSAEV